MSKRLAEVARKVGVSEATVSRVLNDKPGVSDATRQAVLTASTCSAMSARRSCAASARAWSAWVLPELQNPIFPAFAEIVGGALTQNGYTPLLCTQNAGGVTESDYVDLLLAQQVSGVIFLGGNYTQADAAHQHYERLRQVNLPTVLVNARVPELQFATVSTDDAAAAEQAVLHVHQLGHRRIGLLLGPEDHVPSQRKLDSARRLLQKLGAPLSDDLVVRGMYSLESGRPGRRDSSPPAPRPSCARAIRWHSGRCVLHVARGCRCRERLSIVGFTTRR